MPVLFLSHAGKDTQKALDLRDKLLSAPSAREAGLKVWLDVARGLTPGMPWKRQIENVIENEATSFAVMVGDVGVQNWVDAETDAALSRAATDPDFRFIPVLMDGSRSGNLSPFARRYHAVLDPLNKPDQLQALLAAVISKVETEIGLAVLTDEPFRGLASMDESWADRFFGRERETQGLIEQLRSNTVVAIVADSGTGKSSLAKAGVATAWRGGKFNPDSNDKPEPQSWNVVTFRPGKDPLGELKSAVRATAKKMNLSVHDQNSLYNAIDPKNADLSFENLHCGESSQESRTLLIIDQAEELFTQTTNVDKRKEFCRFLGALAQKGLETRRLRILLTIRADYANLLCGQEGLSDFLGQLDEGKNSYRLKAPDAEYLRMMVEKPLKMAGFTDELQITQLIEKIENDVPSGDGNLAMIQFALGETWKRGRVNKNLIAGYDSLKGVLGALGTTAEHYIHVQADPEWEKRIVPVFLRLIKLGESAQRVIRRTASMGEFSEKDQKLIAGFASSEGGRLLQVSEASVEISHESLITQWSRLHSVIERYPREIRVLNRITERCTEWIVSGRKRKFLTSLAEKDSFQELAAENASWLSNAEQLFLRKSKTNYKFSQFLKASIASVMLIALVASIGFFRQAKKAEYSAQQSQANALVYLGKSLLESDPVAAVKLLLSAWPRNEGDTFPATRQVIQSLSRSTLLQKTRVIIPDISIYSRVVFTPDNNSLIVLSREGVLRLWDADSGIVLREVNLGVGLMIDFDISRDGTKIVTVSENGVVQLWDATTGATLGDSMYGWEDEVMNVTFSPDSTLILIRSTGNEFLFWDIASSEELGEAFQGDEMTAFRIKLSGFDYKRSADGRENFELDERIMSAQDIAVSNDGTKFVTGSGIGAIQVWDTTSGLAIGGAMTVLGGGGIQCCLLA